jgi:DNA-binding response OmpR family regulator
MIHRPVVVLLEDARQLSDVVRDVLEEDGFEVLAANAILEAMDFLRSRHVDVLVCDWAGCGGGDPAADPMKSIVGEFPDLALVTVYEPREDEVPLFGPWRSEGKNKMLRRPFRLDDLVGALRSIVG